MRSTYHLLQPLQVQQTHVNVLARHHGHLCLLLGGVAPNNSPATSGLTHGVLLQVRKLGQVGLHNWGTNKGRLDLGAASCNWSATLKQRKWWLLLLQGIKMLLKSSVICLCLYWFWSYTK